MELLGQELVGFFFWLAGAASACAVGWGVFAMVREGRKPPDHRNMGRAFQVIGGGLILGALAALIAIVGETLFGAAPSLGFEPPFGAERPGGGTPPP